jgi:prepilin-type N-terminal cleavage/methylation domain-containing protein
VKKAFSLMELMIVIVIIGAVYTLAITNLKPSVVEEKAKLSLLTLKEYLMPFTKEHQDVLFVCAQNCSDCSIYVAGEKVQDIEGFLQETPEVYRYDFFQGAIAINDNNCFSFRLNNQKISDQLLVIYQDKVYDYTPYFSTTKVYTSLDEAITAKEETIRDIQ